jgi:hypothetical protein
LTLSQRASTYAAHSGIPPAGSKELKMRLLGLHLIVLNAITAWSTHRPGNWRRFGLFQASSHPQPGNNSNPGA